MLKSASARRLRRQNCPVTMNFATSIVRKAISNHIIAMHPSDGVKSGRPPDMAAALPLTVAQCFGDSVKAHEVHHILLG